MFVRSASPANGEPGVWSEPFDGVGLKVMVDSWATAPASAKSLFLQTAFAVRKIQPRIAAQVEGGRPTLKERFDAVLEEYAIPSRPCYHTVNSATLAVEYKKLRRCGRAE